MLTAHREEVTVAEDGSLTLTHLPFVPGDKVEVIVLPRFASAPNRRREPRPYGLCAGEFVVPKDFDAPLPDEILDAFEGK
ncbi:hypothetical protein [Armatimonas sp.]|uniref:hypothetical protein n=1 Tax=Armatimonas sp. TaxID=1872638 RepID=UPI00286A3CBC|nr:hypothetical protein [Armatimonas sp.]